MGRRRLYELAQEHGLTSAELIARLERAGIDGKKPQSSMEESEVQAALAQTDGDRAASSPRKASGRKVSAGSSSAAKVSPKVGAATAPERVPAGERLRLRMRLRQLRRLHDAQLKELAGLAVELHRLGSNRYEELAAERLKRAAATDEELMELERQLDPEDMGGACPNCGLHSSRTRYCLRCGAKLSGRRSDSMSVPGALVAVLAIAAAWLLGGANLGGDTSSQRVAVTSPTTTTAQTHNAPAPPKFHSIVATVKGSRIGVYHSPTDGSPYTTLDSPNLDGAKLVFLVKSIQNGWANVLLPSRPNGSSGWIKVSKVSLAGHDYQLFINLDRHRLTLLKAKKVVLRTPVGVGRAVTPTPSGLYFITELLRQPDPTGLYGPYAFGLSAHSNVLHEFAGRDGVLGLHGTNFPQGIGTDVSHGCLRVSNNAILKLARILPLGTPVRIFRRA